jgi:enamine deaminase RidA (YjgF/YER057c/UK114 family)
MASSSQVRHYRHELENAVGYSQAVVSGRYLFLSGSVSMNAAGECIGQGDMATQIETIYSDIRRILMDYGIGFQNVVRETIYTTDMKALVAAAPVRLKFFEKVAAPAATWVQVAALFAPEYLLEVEITAELLDT